MNKLPVIQSKIISVFVIWRLALFIVAALAGILITQFGARFPYYQELLVSTGLPNWIWGFGNFDGVHYLNIARQGYFAQYSQAFFPLFPLAIKLVNISGNYFLTGLIFANLVFLISLFCLYKLFNLDFNHSISFKSIILLLVFPTSYYFGSVYSESLFLLLVVISLWYMRKKQFFLAGVITGLASATRIFGVFLVFSLVWEIYHALTSGQFKIKSRQFAQAILGVILAPLGLIAYMVYLKENFNDPFYFLNAQPVFGAARSNSDLILLPQVLYRYFKMLVSIPVNSLSFFNVSLELMFTVIPLILLVWMYKKIRFSYWIFILGCLILPSLTGTFSSMPRYALMGFLLIPFITEKLGGLLKYVIFTMAILEAILVSLFVRGYWVA